MNHPPRSKPSLLPFASLVALLCAATTSPAGAATVAESGTEVFGEAWKPNGIAWMNRGYGTAGYFLAKTAYGEGNNKTLQGGYNEKDMTLSAPAWAALSAAEPQVNGQINFGYRKYQDPSGSGSISVGYMGRLWSSKMVLGQEYPLFDFAITGPAPATFDITITYHPELNAPSALTLVQTAGQGQGKSVTIEAGEVADKFEAGFTTFTVTGAKAGDVFQILGTATDADRLVINGILIQADAAP